MTLRQFLNNQKAQALHNIGGLSNTTKMPCLSWGIPVTYCNIGSKLIDNPRSACFKCYANRGTYNFPIVKNKNEDRYRIWKHGELS